MNSSYFLTTAIDYANAPPHIGHAYEKIGADIVARYHRLCGGTVFFLTGCDEHGLKIEQTAAAAGKSSRVFVDEVSDTFKNLWQSLNISYDRFIRTTDLSHQKVVQAVFGRLVEKGDIYKGTYKGLYCIGCEDSLRERDLVDGLCPNHKRAPVETSEDNYFFRLSAYKEAVRAWLEQADIAPESRRREALNQLDDPEFGDISISRPTASVTWGIPVPGDDQHVIYVWIDALLNYISGIGYRHDEELFQRFWPADLHLIGKDIVKFHAIYWPALLLALDLPLPKRLFGHGFITVEGQKISKSLGNVIDPAELVKRFGADALRYFLFAANAFEADGDFSQSQFKTRVNQDLANGLGNLLNRTVSQVVRHFDARVPQGTIDSHSLTLADTAQLNYHKHLKALELSRAIGAVWTIVDQANKFLNDSKPWTLLKEAQADGTGGKRQEAASALLTSLELLRHAAVLLSPVVPALAQKIWDQLGFQQELSGLTLASASVVNPIPQAQVLRHQGPVFLRLE